MNLAPTRTAPPARQMPRRLRVAMWEAAWRHSPIERGARAVGIKAASSFKTSGASRRTVEVGGPMAPLLVMLVLWLVSRAIGFAGWWAQANSWCGALRVTLAGMFLFTAVSHFHPRTRPDLIHMVPLSLREPALLSRQPACSSSAARLACSCRRPLARRRSA